MASERVSGSVTDRKCYCGVDGIMHHPTPEYISASRLGHGHESAT